VQAKKEVVRFFATTAVDYSYTLHTTGRCA